ncbi:MAG: class I SAM-dependent methyltransferase [Candidatus Aminicenantes bacterium]|nr:class I SAM-dependent methyltransferase [Candidatus Aminicenantes bacterium]
MDETPWQLRLVRRSIKKKDKLRLLEKAIPPDSSRTALDLGCAQGILSYFLRRRGGLWVSADQDLANLRTAREILGTNLVQMPPGVLPFRTAGFDLVACLDYLEHIDNDRECLNEVGRVLRPGGELILITPQTGRPFVLHRLRRWLGLGLEFYGHKREGYRRPALELLLREAGLEPTHWTSYSKFFSEAIELALNFLYIKVLSRPERGRLRDGHIRPATGSEFEAQEKPLRLYGLVYPFVWLASRLDKLLFFVEGYVLVVRARKPGP